MNQNLKKEIESLIQSKREGEYWDFKLEHHKNNADLIHDIICMANTPSNRDCYIIFGIEDKTFEVKGVETDSNRKTQQNIIDFLKSMHFAGGIRPIIELRELSIDNHSIDVLIIKNTYNVPYYLEMDYSKKGTRVLAYRIYTRIGDTNTPTNGNADINYVDQLYRKKFRLDASPLEQLKEKLQNKLNWKRNDTGFYNIFNPEFRILIENDPQREGPEFYSYMMMNPRTSYDNLSLKYHETTLANFVVTTLDSGIFSTITPDVGAIRIDCFSDENYYFAYYTTDSLKWKICEFLCDNSNIEQVFARKRLHSVVLIFENEIEREHFLEYVKENLNQLQHLINEDKTNYDFIKQKDPIASQKFIKEIKSARALKKMQQHFLSQLQ